MKDSNSNKNKLKKGFHSRNKHNKLYEFKKLTLDYPILKKYIIANKFGNESINYSDPLAVKALNTALLKHYYKINYWDIPEGYLCPPIPGRAEYIHNIADLLASSNNNIIPKGKKIKCLDVGVGANCIYPIIGAHEYGWSFIGSDISKESISSAKNIIIQNKPLLNNIELRLQKNNKKLFKNIINETEKIHLTICNPPFHESLKEAQISSKRKVNNLNKSKNKKLVLNFGGKNNELWCKGGEKDFIQKMIIESKEFSNSVLWFSTLVSKKENVKMIEQFLKKVSINESRLINLEQGNKKTRVIAWTFINKNNQKKWFT